MQTSFLEHPVVTERGHHRLTHRSQAPQQWTQKAKGLGYSSTLS